MISTHFAPDIHVGAKRMTKFAKYLPNYGWQPLILTKEVGEYHGVDETLLQELPPDLPIYRVQEWRLPGSQTSSAPATPRVSNQSKPMRTELRHRLLRAADFFLFYDYSWLLPAFLTARRLVRENNIQVIYSSIPNSEAHLVALLLKLTMPVKWVCEYRDPWTRAPVAFYPPTSPLQPLIEWALEGKVLAQADQLIFVGPKYCDRVLEGRPSYLAAKAAILYNGYDEDDFAGLDHIEMRHDFPFTIGHIGTFGRWVTPDPFLRALGMAICQRPELGSRICVRFIGEVKYNSAMERTIPQIIQREGLDEVVGLEPFLSHRDALTQMKQCHCLLFIRNYLPEAPNEAAMVVGAKIFEYIRAQRSILALVPPEGDAARLVRELGAGVAVAAEDMEGVVRAILEMYDAFCQGEVGASSDLIQIQQFEHKNQTKKLAEILNAVVKQ